VKIHDFRLPQPLLEPDSWPHPKEPGSWILPLDFASEIGGPLQAYFLSIMFSCEFIWSLNPDLFDTENSVECEIRRSAAKAWLTRSRATGFLVKDESAWKRMLSIFPDELDSSAKIGERVWLEETHADRLTRPQNHMAWSEAIFPAARAQAASWENLVKAYWKALAPRAGATPWSAFGFFAGYLRRSGQESLADVVNLEWSRFAVLYSPQDEFFELSSLEPGHLLLNPTLSVLQRQADGEEWLEALVRRGRSLSSEKLDWREAALIDELRESPRITAKELLAHVRAEIGDNPPPGTKTENMSYENALERLLFQGVILLKVQKASSPSLG
jgi:hypothetical protein